MSATDKITLEGEHGQYQTRTGSLDIMIRHVLNGDLPTSVAGLQREIRERSGDPNYKIHTVTEGLMILAEYEGYATN